MRRRASLSKAAARALGARSNEEALETVVASIACECAYDADPRYVAQRLADLEQTVVLPALRASARFFGALAATLEHIPLGASGAHGKRHFVGVELSVRTATNRALVLETVDCYYYALGGTQTTRDLISDANYWMTTLDKDSGARAHKGFLARADLVAVDAMYDKARAQGKRLVMCGHSLGGATVVLATILFLLERPEAAHSGHVHCITFASPPVGNEELSRLIAENNWSPLFTHVCAPEDRISRLLLSRPSYVHLVPPRYLLDDGQMVDKARTDSNGETLERAHRDSVGLLRQPRGVVYVHAMKTYREKLMLTLRQALSSLDENSFRSDIPHALPIHANLGPAPLLKRAVGILTREGNRASVLISGNKIDTHTCSRTRAEIRGWSCAATSTILDENSLLVHVAPPVLHGAPLPTDSLCSPWNHASWMPMVIGARGEFSTAFINVNVIRRTILLIHVYEDDKSWLPAMKEFVAKSHPEWNIEECGPMKRDVIDAFISTKRGCICIHTVPSDEGSMVTVRCGGGVGDDSGIMASVADHRGVEKAIRTSLVPTEMDALQAAMLRTYRPTFWAKAKL